jgi:hypothetical protein
MDVDLIVRKLIEERSRVDSLIAFLETLPDEAKVTSLQPVPRRARKPRDAQAAGKSPNA